MRGFVASRQKNVGGTLDMGVAVWQHVDMTTTHTTTTAEDATMNTTPQHTELLDAVEDGIRGYYNSYGEFNDDDMAALSSDAGLCIAGCVVWLRDDNTLVLWTGNEHDPDMNYVVERPITSL